MKPVYSGTEGTTVAGPVAAELAIDFSTAPAPTSISFGHLSRLGEEVSLVVGYVSIPEAANAMAGSVVVVNGVPTVKLNGRASNSFVMSLHTFVQLRDRMNEFSALLERTGVKLPNIPKGFPGETAK